MHVDGKQEHQDNVSQQVDIVDVLEKRVPSHAQKTGHQLMSKQLLASVENLEQKSKSKSISIQNCTGSSF